MKCKLCGKDDVVEPVESPVHVVPVWVCLGCLQTAFKIEKDDDCLHQDHKGGYCIDCGKDVLDKLIIESDKLNKDD